jgi:esterase/lipase superfamily enzyme
MHRHLRLLPAVLLLAVVAACSALGQRGVIKANLDPAAETQTVFVASTRTRGPDGSWGRERGERIIYSRHVVSVPPSRVAGQVPRFDIRLFDPTRDFVVTQSTDYESGAEFAHAVKAASAADEAFIFVHGFNTNYSNSLYQMAQIGADIDVSGARILYVWPAQRRLSGYLRDTREAIAAGAGLIELVETLAGAGVRRIVLAGYSLGAVVVVEALRDLSARQSPALRRLGGVVMLSPDIDTLAFRRAAIAMGGLPQPFVVYGTPTDLALKAPAAVLGKGVPRLGTMTHPEVLADLQLIYVDVGYVRQVRANGHLPVVTAPSMIEEINAMDHPDMVRYAVDAAAGAVPGADVRRYGKLTYVTLPSP